MRAIIKRIVFCLILLLNLNLFSQALGYNNHRIAVSADGNKQADNHVEAVWPRADPDDWGGTPAALAMIAKLGLQDKLMHYSYNNFIGAPKHTTETNYMADGVNGAIEKWDFDATRFFDVPEDNAAAITHLANEIKKSTADDPLYYIHMGPSEFFYQAVKEVVDGGNIDALSHVHAISHSGYNDDHLRRYAHHTMAETITLSGDRIQYKKIKDQNACDNPDILWCSGYDFAPFHWMRDHTDQSVQWLYSRLQNHPTGKGADISDAGMVYYLLLGDENGNLSKFQTFIGDGVTETSALNCTDVNLNGINDFEMSQIGNFVISYKDTGRNAVAVNAGLYKDVFGATQKVFEGNSGYYNITLTTLKEIDGESTYRLRVDGELIGEFQNPETDDDMSEHMHTFEEVYIKTGDVFQIESNTHTNGKIPEGDGTAYARGRWRSINFDCTAVECEIQDRDNMLVFEAERFELKGQWKLGTDSKASGGEYIYFDGANSYQNVNSANNISYTFKINDPGNYTFKWTMRQPEGERGSDLGNDAWFYFSDDIAKAGDLVLTKFYKFVGRSDDEFTLNGSSDINHSQSWVRVNFPSAGEYTLNLSGRSHGFQLDRIVLFKGMSIDDAEDKIKTFAETTNCEHQGPAESVGFFDYPANFSDTQLNLPIEVKYVTLEEDRDIHISVLDVDGTTVIKTKKITVGKGASTESLFITLDQTLSIANNYKLKAELRPKDGVKEDNLNVNEVLFNVIDGNTVPDSDEVRVIESPAEVSDEAMSISLKFAYKAKEQRHINFAVYDENNAFVKNTRVAVPVGIGESTITLNLSAPLAIAEGYRMALSIRVFNGNWQTDFDSENINFNVVDASTLSADSYNKYSFRLLGNPIKDNLIFDNNKDNIKEIQLFNLNGQRLIISHVRHGINRISTKKIAKGMYVVHFKFNDNTTKTLKIVKQ